LIFSQLYKFTIINKIPFAQYEGDFILLHSENYDQFNDQIKRDFEKWDVLPFII